ncbi:MAG TPA: EAL domain-containing protein [Solirubrobacteraceae bacterium]|nr:EAL domain-containing protein [Solirubrobacteraceae bacterium]
MSASKRLRLSLRRCRSVWAATALLVLAGALASVIGARAAARSQGDKARLAFQLASAEIASTLKLAIQHEEDLVVSASAFISGNPHASPADFDRWAEAVHAMQRYPELQNIGLVMLVPASQLAAFEARIAASPVRALGPQSPAPKGPFQILPPGQRPYYCFAVAGLARSAASYLPAGVDYCALAPTMITARDSGLASYAPVMGGRGTLLGLETPVYRGGIVPATLAARRRAFIGWLGELLVPKAVLSRALEGHPGLAVILRYNSRYAHVAFASGRPQPGGQSTRIELTGGHEAGLYSAHEGWTMQSFAPPVAAGVFTDREALALLLAGLLLSTLLGALVLVLATGRGRALSLVREKTRELSHQALHDPLTGLPNRALVLDRAEQLLARAARQPGTLSGALFIDVDDFKHVNDNLGHAGGDRLLAAVGARLQGAVREQDTVGRLGGDEFVVLFDGPAEEQTLDMLADRLIDLLREPVELDARTFVSVTVSVGVTIGCYAAPDDLLRDADLALYAAKAAGKDRYTLFDAALHTRADGHADLEADMGEALADEQFFLLYQPIFDLARQRVVGAEALIRWRHPQRGVIAPDGFIPLAEQSGLIVPIGRWVLEQACRQAAAWNAAGLQLGISVNVSANQLARKGFTDDVRGVLARSGLAGALLTLEITETTLMRDVAGGAERLRELKLLGVRVAIDDFGTGYASLSRLQRMSVDILKIDRSFVAALNDGGHSRELLEAILGVAQSLSLAVVAEGVEEQSQKTTLEELGCAMAQGFFLGRPGPEQDVESLVGASGRPAPSPHVS